MLERLKKLFRSVSESLDGEPDSFDQPRPQRVNPNPPANDWFARVRSRSLRARAVADVKALDALDAEEPVLHAGASRQVDDVLAKTLGGR